MKTLIRLAAIIIIIGLAIYLVSRPKAETPNPIVNSPTPPATEPTIPSPETGWKRFDSAAYAFSIAYPRDYVTNESHIYRALGPGHDIYGIAFMVPAVLTEGTNLSKDSYLSVERQELGADKCQANAFVGDPRNSRAETINGRSYAVAESGDAGAGNFYDETIYVTSAGQYCYGLRLFIHSMNIANYDPGTVREFDRAALLDTFSKFRSTFAIGQ